MPDGFYVGTPAYAGAAVTADLDAVLAAPGPGLAGRARAALLAVAVPDDVAAAVTAAYAALGDSPGSRCGRRPGARARRPRSPRGGALRAAFPIIPMTAPVAGAGFLALGLARRLAGPDLDAAALHDVLRGLPHNVTTEMDLALWSLATRLDGESTTALRAPSARALPAPSTPALRAGTTDLAARYRAGTLPAVLQREPAVFLHEHGHRTAAEIDLGVPRWCDDPTPVLGSPANYLRLTKRDDHPDVRFARAVAVAEATVTDVVARVRQRSRLRALGTAFALRRVRQLAGMRETHKDYLVRLLAHVRAHLVVIGAEPADHGRTADASDVFFLELHEVDAALDGAPQHAAVAARRGEYARELRRRHIPRLLLSDGTEPEAPATSGTDGTDGALVGTPASAGTVTATV